MASWEGGLQSVTMADILGGLGQDNEARMSGHWPMPAGAKLTDPVIDARTGVPFKAWEDGHTITYEDIDFYLLNGVPQRYTNDKEKDIAFAWLGMGNLIVKDPGSEVGGLGYAVLDPYYLINDGFKPGAREQAMNFGSSVWEFIKGGVTGGGWVSAIIGGVVGAATGQIEATTDLAARAKASHDKWLAMRRARAMASKLQANIAAVKEQAAIDAKEADYAAFLSASASRASAGGATAIQQYELEKAQAELAAIKRRRLLAVALPVVGVALGLGAALWWSKRAPRTRIQGAPPPARRRRRRK